MTDFLEDVLKIHFYVKFLFFSFICVCVCVRVFF